MVPVIPRVVGVFVVMQEESRRLEFPLWLIAWDRYVLAAQVVDHQLEFRLALLHREVVQSVACAAAAGGRTDLLGVLYDEMARFHWLGTVSALSFSALPGRSGRTLRDEVCRVPPPSGGSLPRVLVGPFAVVVLRVWGVFCVVRGR